MSSFLRTAVATATVITILGGVLVVAVDRGTPTSPDAVAATSAQVEEDAAEPAATGGLLESPVQVGPGSAVALLESLRAAYSTAGLPSTQRVVLSRDPFRPVIPRPDEGGGGSTDPGDPTDPTGPVDPADPTDPGTPTTPGATDACSGDDAETVCDGRVVTLDGFTDAGQALVTVDGVQFTVVDGDEFAGSFRVLATNAPCATLLYGDESFSICTGVTVLK